MSDEGWREGISGGRADMESAEIVRRRERDFAEERILREQKFVEKCAVGGLEKVEKTWWVREALEGLNLAVSDLEKIQSPLLERFEVLLVPQPPEKAEEVNLKRGREDRSILALELFSFKDRIDHVVRGLADILKRSDL
jgi:hypothetical protein